MTDVIKVLDELIKTKKQLAIALEFIEKRRAECK